MTTNANLDPAKFEDFGRIAMIKKATQLARDRNFACFKDYLASKQEKDLGELLICQESRNVFATIHSVVLLVNQNKQAVCVGLKFIAEYSNKVPLWKWDLLLLM